MKSRFMSMMAGTLLVATCASAFADTGAPSVQFDINRLNVRGNTLLPATTVDSLVVPYFGK